MHVKIAYHIVSYEQCLSYLSLFMFIFFKHYSYIPISIDTIGGKRGKESGLNNLRQEMMVF